jgi:hypothetical protein
MSGAGKSLAAIMPDFSRSRSEGALYFGNGL